MQVESMIWDKDAVQALIATNDKALRRMTSFLSDRKHDLSLPCRGLRGPRSCRARLFALALYTMF
jgi:hypothetical protein